MVFPTVRPCVCCLYVDKCVSVRVWRAIVDLAPHGNHFGLQPIVLEKCGRCVLIFSAASCLEAFARAAAAFDRLCTSARIEPAVTRHSIHRF
eukprot:COSAG01_NODE_65227_length_274_cov_0.554286_1_plen_91_part_11